MNDERDLQVQERQVWVLTRKVLKPRNALLVLFLGILVVWLGYRQISRSSSESRNVVQTQPEMPVGIQQPEEISPPRNTPHFVIPQGGLVTLTPAMLASRGVFYEALKPALVLDVLPDSGSAREIFEQPTSGYGRTPLARADCGYVFCNSVGFAFFYEPMTISVIDRQGATHSMTVPAGGYRINWWDVSHFLANYSTQNFYEVVYIKEIMGTEISPELAVRPSGLLNIVVVANEGTEHNLYMLWDPASPHGYNLGPIDGASLVADLMTKTSSMDFYLPPGANCLWPEYQALGHTSGPCPEEDIRPPDWTSADGNAGGTYNQNGEPMGIALLNPHQAP